jgi:hypothetical protein
MLEFNFTRPARPLSWVELQSDNQHAIGREPKTGSCWSACGGAGRDDAPKPRNIGGPASDADLLLSVAGGVGVVHYGHPVHGLMHPELGHIYIRRHPADSNFAGVCPYHGDCLEGLACGAAIVARTGRVLSDAAPRDRIWAIEVDYLGQLCALLVLSHSPQRILIGGGVM